ncbi:MAG: protein jag [Oscillospiraceae bacterium]|nr:protein jag [Oscillospiraceae bacterium]
MEKIEIFTGKTFEETRESAATAFGADEQDINFEIIEQPKKGLFGMKGEFRVRAIYTPPAGSTAKTPAVSVSAASPSTPTADSAAKTTGEPVSMTAELQRIIDYVSRIVIGMGAKDFTTEVKIKSDGSLRNPDEDCYVLNIVGDNLGIVIGRRGENLDALQYLAILANNRGGEGERLRLIVDCNGYREKRATALEALTIRVSEKVLKQGRRVTLEPMNPYERRVIHSKVAGIAGVYSTSTGEEPYRKVVISAELPKRRSNNDNTSGNERNRNERSNNRDNRDNRGGGRSRNSGPMISGREYKQSTGYSTSFEREYKRTLSESPEISQDTVDIEKNTGLYGKIEL